MSDGGKEAAHEEYDDDETTAVTSLLDEFDKAFAESEKRLSQCAGKATRATRYLKRKDTQRNLKAVIDRRKKAVSGG